MKNTEAANKSTLAVTIAWFSIVISVVVLIGWFLDLREVLSIIPTGPTMKFNTALGFLFAGISLFFAFWNEIPNSPIWRKSAAVLACLIGGLTLSQYIIGVDIGIDNWIIQDKYSIQQLEDYPGRMSPATAFCFFLLGGGLLGIHSNRKSLPIISQYFFLVVNGLAFISIISFLFLIPGKHKNFFFNSMAIHTSLLFFLLTLATFMRRPKIGFAKLIFGDLGGTRLMQRLLPAIVILPLILSYLLLFFYQKQWLEVDFGIAIYTVLFILISLIYISIISVGLNKSDTVRRQLETSLHATNRELKYLKEGLDASSIVATTDIHGVILEVNDKFCNVSKYKREELIGSTHNITNSGYHPSSFFKKLWTTISNGNVWIGEIHNRTKTGEYYWVHTVVVPLLNDSGEIYQYLTIKQDITQRKKAKELRERNTLLKERNKEIEQFVYIASHDLQEPLRTVLNSTELLIDQYSDQLDKTGQKCINYIEESSRRMSELIKGLLDYSRIGKNRELQKVNTLTLLKEIQIDIKTQIAESKAKISLGDLPQLMGYQTEIRLLFQNLISNAIKFRRKESFPEILIQAKNKDHFWEFSIKDNGIGISAEHQKRIFFIFQRLHTKRKYEGSGIGLAHCQKIVELHGGKIWVKSTPNFGSTFYFTIQK